MIPNGNYKAKAVSHDMTTASTGTPSVAIKFKITEGDQEGQEITWFGYLTPNAQDRTLESLMALGWDDDDINTLRGFDKNEVELVIEADTYKGETRAKVKWVNELGRQNIRPMAPTEAGLIADRMKAAAQVLRAKRAGGSAPVAAANPNIKF